MMSAVSIRDFRKLSVFSINKTLANPLAVSDGGQVQFYCVANDQYAKLLEAAQMLTLEDHATRRRTRVGNVRFEVSEDAPLDAPVSAPGSKPVLFHTHASEEWRLLPVETQRQAIQLLTGDALSADRKLSEPFAYLALPDSSVFLAYERRPEAILVWSISDRLPNAADIRALVGGPD